MFSNILWSIDVSDSYVASCSENKQIAVFMRQNLLSWNVRADSKPETILEGHEDAVTCISITDHTLSKWQEILIFSNSDSASVNLF